MLRVAFSTTDGVHVDEHFGRCLRFDIYDVSADGHRPVRTRVITTPDEPGDESGRLDARIDAVRDCAIVHLAAIGGGAAARVTNARIHPVKVPETTAIASLLERLRSVLAGTPPPWLRRHLDTPTTSPAGSPR